MSANPLSFLIKIANDQNQTQQPTITHAHPESTKPEPANTNRAKKLGSRSLTRKRQPQRGMGVAQLERLRIQQESWKTGPETNQLPSADVQPTLDPVCGVPVPVQNGAWNIDGGVPVVNIGGFLGRDQGGQLIIKRADNGVEYYDKFNGVIGSGQVLVNRSTDFGPPSMRGAQAESLVNSAAVIETSRELTSMPKIRHHYDQPSICDVCLKKKRFYGENMRHNEQKDTYVEIGYKGSGDNYAEISSINTNGFRFPGLNPQISIDSNGEMDGCNGSHIRTSDHSFTEGDEVVAIYRKGKLVGGNVFMEYEFFPGKNGITTPSKEMECPSEASVAEAGEASWAMASDDNGYIAASNAPNSVDLSLKLSY